MAGARVGGIPSPSPRGSRRELLSTAELDEISHEVECFLREEMRREEEDLRSLYEASAAADAEAAAAAADGADRLADAGGVAAQPLLCPVCQQRFLALSSGGFILCSCGDFSFDGRARTLPRNLHHSRPPARLISASPFALLTDAGGG